MAHWLPGSFRMQFQHANPTGIELGTEALLGWGWGSTHRIQPHVGSTWIGSASQQGKGKLDLGWGKARMT